MAVGEFCGGLGASPTCLSFRFVFFTLRVLWDSHLLPDLHSRFPFFVAPLLFQLQDKNLRIFKTRILDILKSRIHPPPPAPRPLMQSWTSIIWTKRISRVSLTCSLSYRVLLPFCHGSHFYLSLLFLVSPYTRAKALGWTGKIFPIQCLR